MTFKKMILLMICTSIITAGVATVFAYNDSTAYTPKSQESTDLKLDDYDIQGGSGGNLQDSVIGDDSIALTWQQEYPWAVDAVNYCMRNKYLQGYPNGDLALGENITRAQMAKILVSAFSLTSNAQTAVFTDIQPGHWAYGFIQAFEPFMKKKSSAFKPDEKVTREEFIASLVLASGLTEGSVRNPDIIDKEFSDAYAVDSAYKRLVAIGVERAYVKGSNGQINPKSLLTRAEVCAFVQRVVQSKKGEITLTSKDLGITQSSTPMIAKAQITVEQAQAWAKSKNAAQIYIDVAPLYWKYGSLTGISPEIMYAQAAHETGYGHYTGAVKPEMNNWAGIKIKNPTGDTTEDHETFATPEDGVRAHFNHMCAYLGLNPIGEPHDRYYVVKSISWAGSIKTLEELGGRWCPDLYYGYIIKKNFLAPMGVK